MNEPRTAVYCGTRNLYEDMLPAIHSLLAHDGADRVVLVIEDDDFPFPLPPGCETVNAGEQTYFPPDGPNYGKYYTYMALLRAALTKLLPDAGRVLSLDVDTIVDGDISALWETELGDCFLAACPEPEREYLGGPYFQMGVVLFDLERMRRAGVDERIIEDLNRTDYQFPEQDAINVHCFRRIAELDSRFNVNEYIRPTDDPRIYHFAGRREWRHFPAVERFRRL